MAFNVVLDLPSDVEERLRREGGSLETDVKEAYLVDLFRRGKLSHFDLSRALGIDRFETDALLKRHNVFEGSPTMDELEADRKTLQSIMGMGR